MYTTTKNPPGRLCCFPGEFYWNICEQMFHVKHFAGSWRSRRNGRSPFARRDGGRPAAGSGGLYGHQPSSCRRTRTNITPAMRAGMAARRSLPPASAGISSSQLMVIISPAMQAVTMPMV